MWEFDNSPPNNPGDLAAWKNKQREIYGKYVNDPVRKAQLQRELQGYVKTVANRIGGDMLPPPGAKSEAGATEKVDRDYGGNYIEIKDLVRCTLVVANEGKVKHAQDALRAYFSPGNGTGFTVFEEKTVDGRKDKAGYSGWTIFVTQGGYKGEIQINTKEIMYAKDLVEFRERFPNDYDALAAKFPEVPGGIGHKLYEVARKTETSQADKDAHNAASRAYYAYFRSDPPDFVLGQQALAELKKVGLVKDASFTRIEPRRLADELAKLPKLSDFTEPKPVKPPRRPLPPGYIHMMHKPEKPPRSATLPPGFVESKATRPRDAGDR